MISRFVSPALAMQPAITVVQEHLSEISSCVVALVLCTAVVAAAMFMLMVRPSPRHQLILDLWTWVDDEWESAPSMSHFAARRAS